MAGRGRKLDPEKELKKFISSVEEFLHRGQYPCLTILLEGILNLSHAKGKGVVYTEEPSRVCKWYLQKNPHGPLQPASSDDSLCEDIKYLQTSSFGC